MPLDFASAVVGWLLCPAAAAPATEIIRKKEKIRFMLDPIALPRIPETSADWMQSRRGKGAFILPRALAGWKKTLRTALKPEVQGRAGLIGDCKVT